MDQYQYGHREQVSNPGRNYYQQNPNYETRKLGIESNMDQQYQRNPQQYQTYQFPNVLSTGGLSNKDYDDEYSGISESLKKTNISEPDPSFKFVPPTIRQQTQSQQPPQQYPLNSSMYGNRDSIPVPLSMSGYQSSSPHFAYNHKMARSTDTSMSMYPNQLIYQNDRVMDKRGSSEITPLLKVMDVMIDTFGIKTESSLEKKKQEVRMRMIEDANKIKELLSQLQLCLQKLETERDYLLKQAQRYKNQKTRKAKTETASIIARIKEIDSSIRINTTRCSHLRKRYTKIQDRQIEDDFKTSIRQTNAYVNDSKEEGLDNTDLKDVVDELREGEEDNIEKENLYKELDDPTGDGGIDEIDNEIMNEINDFGKEKYDEEEEEEEEEEEKRDHKHSFDSYIRAKNQYRRNKDETDFISDYELRYRPTDSMAYSNQQQQQQTQKTEIPIGYSNLSNVVVKNNSNNPQKILVVDY